MREVSAEDDVANVAGSGADSCSASQVAAKSLTFLLGGLVLSIFVSKNSIRISSVGVFITAESSLDDWGAIVMLSVGTGLLWIEPFPQC